MSSDTSREVVPPRILELSGHPLRWRILKHLASSDRLVKELTSLTDQTQSLVSYHLGKLRDAGLVFVRRSSHDGRDNYYGLDLKRFGEWMSAVGGALHPGLRTVPVEAVNQVTAPIRVLFLCTGNSARSQMAEAFARVQSGGAIQAFSAGSHPKAVHPDAVRVMRDDHDIDISGQTSRHLSEFSGQRFDWVISLCDRVREVCPEFPGNPSFIHWSTQNPADVDPDDSASYAVFQQVASELERRIGFLIALVTDRPNAS